MHRPQGTGIAVPPTHRSVSEAAPHVVSCTGAASSTHHRGFSALTTGKGRGLSHVPNPIRTLDTVAWFRDTCGILLRGKTFTPDPGLTPNLTSCTLPSMTFAEPAVVHVGCSGEGCPRCVRLELDRNRVSRFSGRKPCRVEGCKRPRSRFGMVYCDKHHSTLGEQPKPRCQVCGKTIVAKNRWKQKTCGLECKHENQRRRKK